MRPIFFDSIHNQLFLFEYIELTSFYRVIHRLFMTDKKKTAICQFTHWKKTFKVIVNKNIET